MTRELLLLALLLAPPPAAAQTLVVETPGGTTTIRATAVDGRPAYPAAALVALGAVVHEDAAGLRAVLLGDTLRFETLSPFFRARSGLQQLADPVVLGRDGGMLLPAQLFTEWLPAHFHGRLSFAHGRLRLSAASAPGPRVVVIDAGHGGRDPGRIGPDGVKEKDVTLALAKRLGALLARRGYEVHLTRTRDTLIALADRPRMANEWKAGRPAALFLSIHCNAGVPGSHGFETYFLSDARTEDERRVAEMENAAARYEDKDDDSSESDVDRILNHLRNDYYIRASDDLAEIVQRRLARFEPGPDRGVKRAGFRVLVGAFMPAVLVETAFISDRREERMLARSSFQGKIATALADAVDTFFASHPRLVEPGGGR